jgi:phosphatidylglycerophosphate synthase
LTTPEPPGERRPVATRDLAASRVVASWLAARGLTANSISVAGMVAGLAAGVAFAGTTHLPDHARALWLAGAACIQLRLLANMFDGMVAIETGTTSRVGELYNEVPDRVSDTATLLGLGHAALSSPALGYQAAVVALFVSYVRVMGKAAGASHDFCGPMAKQHRMFVATVAAVWCGVVPVTWQTVGPLGVPGWTLALIVALGLVTAVRRLARISRALRAVA